MASGSFSKLLTLRSRYDNDLHAIIESVMVLSAGGVVDGL